MKNLRNYRPSRRHVLTGGAMGLGGLLLRSLAIGLPPAWLSRPLSAFGQEEQLPDLQTLILSTSSAGDPINANCPGSYGEGFENNELLTPVDFILGNTPTRAAEPWLQLPASLRERLAVLHYRTGSAAHGEYKSTMAFHGAVKNAQGNGSEMFASAIAELSHARLGTLQSQPLPLCKEILTVAGAPLQNLKPNELKALFAAEADSLADLRSLRDQALDDLYDELRANGTRSQRRFLDQYALSKSQARALGENLGTLLESLPVDAEATDGPLDQVVTAVALARLKVAPVITINIPFGQDNHQDSTLEVEAEQTVLGTQAIARLWQELEAASLTESVTFGTMNVFGRTLTRNGAGGRNHNRKHAVMVAFGPNVNPGVFGGVTSDYESSNIDPITGAPVGTGGVLAEESMSAMGKSLAVALGHDRDTVDRRITGGQVIEAFVRSS